MKKIERNSILIITGNIYSKLGPFAHSEFFSMPWSVNIVFQDNVKTNNIVALTPYIFIEDGYIIDLKFDKKYSLKNKVYIYDSKKDLVSTMPSEGVPDLIQKQPRTIRHWVQLFQGTWVQKIVIWLSPRLVYLF